MTDKTAVTVADTLYGWIWHDPKQGWSAEKTGEFETRRHGFDGPLSAEAWVLTNASVHIRSAWVAS